MWNWFNCYLSGRHDFGVWCEPGAIFLRCVHCGRRSSGWSIDARAQTPPSMPTATKSSAATLATTAPALHSSRVLPFRRVAS